MRFDNHEVLKESDMDVVGGLFAIRLNEGMVELYIEDDENFHFKCVFHPLWLKDLITVAKATIDHQVKS